MATTIYSKITIGEDKKITAIQYTTDKSQADVDNYGTRIEGIEDKITNLCAGQIAAVKAAPNIVDNATSQALQNVVNPTTNTNPATNVTNEINGEFKTPDGNTIRVGGSTKKRRPNRRKTAYRKKNSKQI